MDSITCVRENHGKIMEGAVGLFMLWFGIVVVFIMALIGTNIWECGMPCIIGFVHAIDSVAMCVVLGVSGTFAILFILAYIGIIESNEEYRKNRQINETRDMDVDTCQSTCDCYIWGCVGILLGVRMILLITGIIPFVAHLSLLRDIL